MSYPKFHLPGYMKCPQCDIEDTVILEVEPYIAGKETSSIAWCGYGHVSIFNVSEEKAQWKLIYNFKSG